MGGKMKKILIYQHQSSMNHGCEALLYTISEQIKRVCPDSQITVSSFYKKDDEQFEFPNVDYIVQNTQWLRRFSIPWFAYQIDKRLFRNTVLQEKIMYCKPCFEAAKNADVCVAIGGDNYCYNKGKEHWPLERKIKKLGKRMILWGCSIEPSDIKGELEEHLNIFDLITVRDSISYEALINSGVKSKVVCCADTAFLLECQECVLPSGWEQNKMIGLNFSPMVMGKLKNKATAREAIDKFVHYVLDNSDDKIVLIPHVRLDFNDDMEELVPIYNKYKHTNRVLLLDDKNLNARQLKYVISRCKIFVGARTHATIAAYSTGVPTLAIGYSVKARGIARDLFGNEEDMVISIEDLAQNDKLIKTYKKIYENSEHISAVLSEIMSEYKRKALKSAKEFGELMK